MCTFQIRMCVIVADCVHMRYYFAPKYTIDYSFIYKSLNKYIYEFARLIEPIKYV